jgi:hypothetical protein
MPVIPVNGLVDKKRVMGKNWGPRRRRGTSRRQWLLPVNSSDNAICRPALNFEAVRIGVAVRVLKFQTKKKSDFSPGMEILGATQPRRFLWAQEVGFSQAGLPDFSWYNKLKREKYTKHYNNIPNVHEIHKNCNKIPNVHEIHKIVNNTKWLRNAPK